MVYTLVIKNGTIVTPEIGRKKADVGIADGEIAAIGSPGTISGERELDAANKYVLPGAIDPHTHHGIVRELGEDARTESRSGLVGGVTTIGNFLRSGEPYTEIMDELFDQCESNYYHDYFFSLAPLSSRHLEEIPTLVEEYNITSFKWYMRFKHRASEIFGVDRDMWDDYADELLQTLASLDAPTTLGCHSENAEITLAQKNNVPDHLKDSYESLVRAFPGRAETQAMVAAASLAQVHDYDENLYAVHISSGKTADELAKLREIGYGVTGETCTHYLTLTKEMCDKRGVVRPPVRSAEDRKTLWRRVADGTIQCIGTDHCMKPYDEKIGDDFWSTDTAFPSSGSMLPLVLSEGVNEGRIPLERAVAITSTNTAKAWNLYPKKGAIQTGTDADLTVVDLEETKTVTPELLQSAADYTPYEGMEVTGWPTHTVVRGQLAYENGEIRGERGHGTHVDRPIATRD